MISRTLVLAFLAGLSVANALASTETAKLTAPDGAPGDQFGISLALGENRAVVAASWAETYRGSVYVREWDGTNWLQTAKLTASDRAATNIFGCAVALDGDRAVVGSAGAGDRRGAVYVFEREGTNWVQKAKLTASDGAVNDYFGGSVALSGNCLMVGAYGDDSCKGSVYAFGLSGTNWTPKAKVRAVDTAAGDYFGYAMSLTSNRVAVGALYAASSYGAAYVFDLEGTNWVQKGRLLASDGESVAQFGSSVSLSGDRIAVGAQSANSSTGAVYVFGLTGTNWTQTAKLTASDKAQYDYFGSSVALSGSRLVAGACGDDSSAGSAYVMEVEGTNWVQKAKIMASDRTNQQSFGAVVALQGDRVLVGASGDNSNKGAAYVFDRWGNTPPNAFDQKTHAVAFADTAIDLAIDHPDLQQTTTVQIVSSPAQGTLESYAHRYGSGAYPGRWYYQSAGIFGSDSFTWTVDDGLETSRVATCTIMEIPVTVTQKQEVAGSDTAAGHYFGSAVDLSGDYAIVGAERKGSSWNGGAYIFERTSSNWVQRANLMSGNGAGSYFGDSVAIAGTHALVYESDSGTVPKGGAAYAYEREGGAWTYKQKLVPLLLTTNLYFGNPSLSNDRALIGAYGDTEQGAQAGTAYIFEWEDGIWSERTKLLPTDGTTNAYFGRAVSVNGDDALVGAPNRGTSQGAAYVFACSNGTWVQTARLAPAGLTDYSSFGSGVAIRGDYAAVGAPGDADNGSGAGAVYLYERVGGVWMLAAKVKPADGAASARFGSSVSLSGETLVAGAYNASIGGVPCGAVYVFKRVDGVWKERLKLKASDGIGYCYYGLAVAVSGLDVLVGAQQSNFKGTESGSAYFYNLGGAVTTNTAPIAWDQSASVVAHGEVQLDLSYYDPDWQGMTTVLTVPPAHGTLQSYAARYGSSACPNRYFYTSDGTVGTDTFQWVVSDGVATSAPATYAIVVLANQSAPSVQDGSLAIGSMDVRALCGLDAADPDPGTLLRYQAVSLPTHGRLEYYAGTNYVVLTQGMSVAIGSWRYTPNPAYIGEDSFTWRASDGALESGEATFAIAVLRSAQDQSGLVVGTGRTTRIVAPCDVDAQPKDLRVQVVSGPAHGRVDTMRINFYYTPETSFMGSDSFQWRLIGGAVTSETATCGLTVTNVAPGGTNLVLLIVKSTLLPEVTNEVIRLKDDLEWEGRTARIVAWTNASDVALWNYLRSEYTNASQHLEGALLIGELPLTYVISGYSTDLAYWNMNTLHNSDEQHIWVSRFKSEAGWQISGHEVMLMKRALGVNHAYRTGRSRLPHRASVYIDPNVVPNYTYGLAQAPELYPDVIRWDPVTSARNGCELLDETNHGDWQRIYCTPDAFQIDTIQNTINQVRFLLGTSCQGGWPGGVLNSSFLTRGGGSVLIFGASQTTSAGAFTLMDGIAEDLHLRQMLAEGACWGRGLVAHYGAFAQRHLAMFYGDLSLSILMTPSNAMPSVTSLTKNKTVGYCGEPVTFAVAVSDPDAAAQVSPYVDYNFQVEWFPSGYNYGLADPAGTTFDTQAGWTNWSYAYASTGTFTLRAQVQDEWQAVAYRELSVSVLNRPVASNDTASVIGCRAVTIAVTTNDICPGNPFTLQSCTAPDRGTASIVGDAVLYTSTNNWEGVDTFTYTIADAYGAASTGVVSVAVSLDSIAPTIAGAVCGASNRLWITFSKAMDATSAEDPANYGVSGGVTVLSSRLWADGRTVELLVSGLTDGATYTLTVQGVRDNLANVSNVIAADTHLTFVCHMPAGYRMPLTFPGYRRGETLTNFPVLVVLSEGLSGFSYSQFLTTNGWDLRFQGDVGQDLAYEMEKWDPTGNSYAWVQVPALKSNAVIWALWGQAETTNRAACTTNGITWANGYRGVWHLSDGITLGARDATTNSNHAAVSGATATGGVVDGAGAFSGSGQFLSFPSNAGFEFGAGDFAVEAWVKLGTMPSSDSWPGNWSGWAEVFGNGTPGQTNGYQFRIGQTSLAFGVNDAAAAISAAHGLSTNTWYLLGVTRSGSRMSLFRNGAVLATATNSTAIPSSAGSTNYFGTRTAQGAFLNGAMDEVRVSGISRSTNWVWAEYQTVVSNATFVRYAAAELVAPLQIVNVGATNVSAHRASLVGELRSASPAAAATVRVYWGTNDPGPTADGWLGGGSALLGLCGKGVLTNEVSACLTNRTYYFRFVAEEASGERYWAEPPGTFVTATRPDWPLMLDVGASSVTRTNAQLNGTLTYTGASPCTVWCFWGTNDAGFSAAGWLGGGAANLGVQSAGAISCIASGLLADRTYHFRYYVTNALGQDDWGDPEGTFITPEGPGPFKLPITFSGYTNRAESLTNFPVLVVLSNSMSAGFRFDHQPFLSTNGWDLRFKTNLADTGNATLAYEVEQWNADGPCQVWVRVPTIPGDGSGCIWMTWGDPADHGQLDCTTNGAAWGPGHLAVWHMQQTNAVDATSNRNHAASFANTNVASGQVGLAQGFNGTSSHLQVPTSASLDTLTSRVTVSTWVKVTGSQGANPMFLFTRKNNSLEFRLQNAALQPRLLTPADALADSADGLGMGTWYHVAGTYDRGASNQCLYINGRLVKGVVASVAMNNAGSPAYIGERSDAVGDHYYLKGLLDEMRLENTARSSNWVWACYMNMASGAVFTTCGRPQLASVDSDQDGLPDDVDPDDDNDGMSDIDETLAGTDPLNPAAVFGIRSVTISNGVPWLYVDSATGRLYDVYYKGSLLDPEWLPLTNDWPGTGNRMPFLDGGGATQRFYRIRVREP
jgi:hypothetical protein